MLSLCGDYNDHGREELSWSWYVWTEKYTISVGRSIREEIATPAFSPCM